MVSGKACCDKNPPHPETSMQLFDNLADIVDFGSHFGDCWVDFEGGPKIDNCLKEVGWEKHFVVIVFFFLPKWEA